jgi:hypothetical protein
MRLLTLILILLAGLALAQPSQAAAKVTAKPLPAPSASDKPVVSVNPTASVSDTYFTLGEIADIKCADKDLAARLAAAPMGHAPLPGVPRPLTAGDISLKLRQSGIDPSTLTLTGATTLLITSSGDGSGSSPATPSGTPATPQENTILVHVGDPVNLVYVDGTITITARAYALQNGAQGQTITLRRDGVTRTLQGTVLDSQTVQLED